MEKDKDLENGRIENHYTNCQVFNGPISGCIFAMPGSHVEQHPVQEVAPDGRAESRHEEARAEEAGQLVPVADGLPEKILKAPGDTFKWADNGVMIHAIKEAGACCREPEHFACLMAVCDDHGLLVDRSNRTGFARTMAAWGIFPATTEKAVDRLANSMGHTMKKLPLRYKEWGADLKPYRDKCEMLATYFDRTMPYRYGLKQP